MAKTYWKELWRTIAKTKGRFVSLVLLMFLGTVVLVGLKSTVPDMEAKGRAYFDRYQTMDLTVMADYGLSEDDQKELDAVDGAQVEFGYLADVTLTGSHKAVRLFSHDKGQSISQYDVVAGHLPKQADEIALEASYQSDYDLGDTFTIETDNEQVAQNTYQVTGFIHSSEIISDLNKGMSTAGDGLLDGYAVVSPKAFKSEVYSIARLRFDTLAQKNPFSKGYDNQLAKEQQALEALLEDNGAKRLASLQSEAQKDLDKARADLKKGQQVIRDQENQLRQVASFLPAAEKTKAEAEIAKAKAELAKGEDKVRDAEAELAALVEPNYHVYTRLTLPVGTGYTALKNSMEGIDKVSDIFPVVLYFVAALVTFTTMTRFVNEERLNAGLFKALGYTSQAIIRKFVIYGLVASLLGTVLGILGGTYFIPRLIAGISMGSLTIGEIDTLLHWPYIGLALLAAFISAVVPAYLVAKRDLLSKPAELLLPKPPKAGSRIFLERIGFIWRRLTFTHKVTARNIFRYKQRMLMTIFGVMGSVALLFAGLGIRSSIAGIIPSQFEESLRYQFQVVEKEGISPSEKETLATELKDDRVNQWEPIYTENSNQIVPDVDEHQSVTLMVTENEQFGGLVRLYSREGKRLKLTDEGVLVSQKLAKLYGVDVGDKLPYLDQDGQAHEFVVSGISRLYAGHYIMMNGAYYKKTFAKELVPNAHLLSLKDLADQSQLSAELLSQEGVATVVRNTMLIATLDNIVVSLNGVMGILIILSILLAVVVLYNLTTINVAERIRELSTIKVLGFFNREVTLYIYRETIILSLLGIGLGLAAGFVLHRYIINQLGSSFLTLEPQVGLEVYLIPVLAVVAILAGLGWLVNHRLKKLDMLEALKSVD